MPTQREQIDQCIRQEFEPGRIFTVSEVIRALPDVPSSTVRARVSRLVGRAIHVQGKQPHTPGQVGPRRLLYTLMENGHMPMKNEEQDHQARKIIMFLDARNRPYTTQSISGRTRIPHIKVNGTLHALLESRMIKQTDSGAWRKTKHWDRDAALRMVAAGAAVLDLEAKPEPVVPRAKHGKAPKLGSLTFTLEDLQNLPTYKEKAKAFDEMFAVMKMQEGLPFGVLR